MMNHLTTYEIAVGNAYSQLIDDVTQLRSNDLDRVTYYAAMRVVTGKAGALCGSAAKHLKREVVLEALVNARNSGLDITPTAAQHTFERLLGRGVDSRRTLASFSIPGRTAAHKSTVSADDLASLEQRLQAELDGLVKPMVDIRRWHAGRYQAAVARD